MLHIKEVLQGRQGRDYGHVWWRATFLTTKRHRVPKHAPPPVAETAHVMGCSTSLVARQEPARS
eukprot:5677297-Amphidinium_carterae.1